MQSAASSAPIPPPDPDSLAAQHARANALVNPASGIANDYLNIYNEIIMLVENYPQMPDFGADILAWRPVSYAEYWRNSLLPGRLSALQAYAEVEPPLRRAFEAILAEIDELAQNACETVRQTEKFPQMSDYLARAHLEIASDMNACLARATYLVNHGAQMPLDDAQARIDRLMERRQARGRRITD